MARYGNFLIYTSLRSLVLCLSSWKVDGGFLHPSFFNGNSNVPSWAYFNRLSPF